MGSARGIARGSHGDHEGLARGACTRGLCEGSRGDLTRDRTRTPGAFVWRLCTRDLHERFSCVPIHKGLVWGDLHEGFARGICTRASHGDAGALALGLGLRASHEGIARGHPGHSHEGFARGLHTGALHGVFT